MYSIELQKDPDLPMETDKEVHDTKVQSTNSSRLVYANKIGKSNINISIIIPLVFIDFSFEKKKACTQNT